MDETIESSLRLRCERDDLLAAVQAADAVVPSNSAKPILTNLMLDAREGQVEIVATDLQVGLRAVVRRVEVDSPGQVVVPARQLNTILKESRSPAVSLVLETGEANAQLVIELADGDYRIPAVVGETFPQVSAFPADQQRVAVPGEALEQMIRKAAFAVDRDRTSAVLSGVHLSIGDGELVLAATDGKVLAEAVHQDDSYQADEPMVAIVPSSTIQHLNRILGTGRCDAVELAIAGKLIFIRATIASGEVGGAGSIQVELTSRLIDGAYPAYRNALPASAQHRVTFTAKELASAVRRTALMTSSAARGIVLEVANDQAILSNLTTTTGTARIPLSCRYQGPEVRLGLNAQYLGDVLRAFDGDEFEIELNGSGRGLIVREPAVTFLIMPITLPN